MEMLKNFFKDEDGMGTVEMVVIIAVLLGIALLFRKQVLGFVSGTLDKIFSSTGELHNVQSDPLSTTP